jgi:hypothetical protein
MKPKFGYTRYIERYLDDEMVADEINWFEKELEENPDLLIETNLRSDINAAIAQHDVIDLRTRLDGLFNEQPKTQTSFIWFIHSYGKYIAAAMVALFIAIGSIMYLNNKPLTSAEIYREFYEPYNAGFNFRSSDSQFSNDLRMAMTKYQEEKFSEALVLFEKVLEQDASGIGLKLYSGISHMELEQFNQANEDFSAIIKNNYSLYIEQAEWYLSFCYLMTGKKDKARELFGAIARSDSYYHKEAKKIIKRLK